MQFTNGYRWTTIFTISTNGKTGVALFVLHETGNFLSPTNENQFTNVNGW